MEKGIFGGVLLTVYVLWAPFDRSWPALENATATFGHLLDAAAMMFLKWQ